MKNHNSLPFVVSPQVSSRPFARLFAMLGLFGLMLCLAAISGCGGGTAGLPGTGSTDSGGGRIVTQGPTGVMPWAEAETLPRGTVLYAWVNRAGTEVREYSVTLLGTQVGGSNRVLSCRLTDPKMLEKVVGAGDSGSPVVTKEGRLVAVLFGGFGNEPTFFLARAAEDVQNFATTAKSPDVVAFSAQPNRPLALIAAGVPDRFWNTEFGGQKPLSGFRSRQTTPSAGRVIDEVPTAPLAGHSIAVMELSGDAANMYAVGVLALPTADGFVAFGHPYMGSGQSALPVRYAATDTMVGASSGVGVFKWAHPIGQTMGTMSQDSNFGCAITWGATPTTIPVVVEVTYKGQTKTYRHQAAIGRPIEEAFRGWIACLASVEAAVNGERVIGRAQGSLFVTYALSGEVETRLDLSSDWSIVDDTAGQLQMTLQTSIEQISEVRFTLDVNGDVVDY